MSWVARAFDEFGRSIGLPGLHPNTAGRLSLLMAGESRLDFTMLEDRVLLLLLRPLNGASKLLAMRRALDACHVRHGWSLPVRAGLSREGQLLFIAHVPLRDLRPDTLDRALDLLRRLHDRVEA
jgi:type III secretion system chaperone SycN